MTKSISGNQRQYIRSAEILSVGTEILMGKTLNTNANYLALRLCELGIPSYYQTVVGDNPERLEKVFGILFSRSDTIIVTGGLGPTGDDITLAVLAKFLGLKTVHHRETEIKLREYFRNANKKMPGSNLKQAMVPEGARILCNCMGTAPGIIMETDFGVGHEKKEKKRVILLPGPPVEMEHIFREYVEDYLIPLSPVDIKSRYIRVFGMGESEMEEKIRDIIDKAENPTLATYCSTGECLIRISHTCSKEKEPVSIQEEGDKKIHEISDEIKKRLGDYVYGTDEMSLPEKVLDMLREKELTLSFAESCTGGMLSSFLVKNAGASKVFKGSVTVYSNRSKIKVLGVKPETIEKYGAVSVQTAQEMAKACRELFESDIGVSVTGIAGPGGGTAEKPVGLVYLSVCVGESNITRELKIKGGREKIRVVSSLNAFDLIRRTLPDV